MTFTVLGASGYIGSCFVRHLRRGGGNCFAPSRDDDRVFDRPLGHVVYCIGLTADYQRRPLDTVAAHVCVLADLLRRARFDSLLYLSSTRLYDSRAGSAADAPCREDDDLLLNPHNPRHIFDLSKATGEALCLGAGETVRVARLACVYGGDLERDNFLHGVLRQAIGRKSMRLATSPDMARDYIHMDDVAALLRAIATRGRHRIYNVASGANVRNRELLAAIGRATGCAIAATREGGDAAPRIGVERIAAEFDIRPRPVLDAIPGLVAACAAPAVAAP
ncbi:MAG: NAD(P)-dependent oxidoreductase [Dongiaceae bacterium]